MGQPVHQIAVHGAHANLTLQGTLTHPGHVFHDPAQLGSGKIGRQAQTCFFADGFRQSLAFDAIANGLPTGALPHNGVVYRGKGCPIPCHGGFPLVADAHGSNLLTADAALRYEGLHQINQVAVDFLRVMLHPAVFIDDLPMGVIQPQPDLPPFVKQHDFRALGALVNANDVGHDDHPFPCSAS